MTNYGVYWRKGGSWYFSSSVVSFELFEIRFIKAIYVKCETIRIQNVFVICFFFFFFFFFFFVFFFKL